MHRGIRGGQTSALVVLLTAAFLAASATAASAYNWHRVQLTTNTPCYAYNGLGEGSNDNGVVHPAIHIEGSGCKFHDKIFVELRQAKRTGYYSHRTQTCTYCTYVHYTYDTGGVRECRFYTILGTALALNRHSHAHHYFCKP